MKPIRLVCATRVAYEDFEHKTALGRSLALTRYYRPPQLVLFDNNADGLSSIYNLAIEQAKADPAILIFVHDDVHLNDFFWIDRIREALQKFDIVGVAGNTRRLPNQPAWFFADPEFKQETAEHLSGVVGHGDGFPCKHLCIYGPVGRECKLLDGVLMAVDSERLHAANLSFDEQFTFDFYDMDFCRQAEQKGLTMGTLAMSVIHESVGAFNSPRWQDAYRRYLHKYTE